MSLPRTAVFLLLLACLALPGAAQEARAPLNRRDLLLRAARNQVKALNVKQASAYYEEYLKDWPDDAHVATEYCGVLLQAKRVDEAVTRLKKLLEKDGKNRQAIGLLVDAHMMNQDFAAAAGILEDALKRDNADLTLRRKLADVYAWSERYPDAIRQYRFLTDARPGDRDLEKRLLEVMYWGAMYDDYLAESQRYLEKVPADFTVRMTRVDLYAARRDFPAAAAECRIILQLDPKQGPARARLAQLLSWMGDHEAALEAYREALTESPDDAALRREYGQLLLWGHRTGEAIVVYRKLHEEFPDDENVSREYLEVAAAADPMADTERAWVKAFYARAMKPDAQLQPGAMAALARALNNAGMEKEALAMFTAAVKANPRDLSLRLQYADLLSMQGRMAEAEQEYELLLKKTATPRREKGE